MSRTPVVPAAGDAPRPAAGRAAEFFELLLEDAAAIEYERPLVHARAAGADADTLAELERVKLLALQVREAFAARRRRESGCPRSSTPRATWPRCAGWTRCSPRSSGAPASCWAPTSPT